jgi:hypothetical protein
MLRESNPIEEIAKELEGILARLVECYALPHTRICMQWTKVSRESYRGEVVGWLEDYARSFGRLPRKTLAGGETLAAFARRRLDAEIARILRGEHAAVERSYGDLFG